MKTMDKSNNARQGAAPIAKGRGSVLPKEPARPVAAAAAREQVKLVRRSGTSLHHQIFLVIRDQISVGKYAISAALPSEQELSRQFHVSRITIRAALATLEANGFVDRRHGIGTFVSERVRPPPIHAPMADLLEHIADVNRSTRVELRELSFTTAPLRVQPLFGGDPDQLFQRAVRIRSLKGVPIFHVLTLLPERVAKQLTRKEMGSESLYQLLRNKGFQFKSGKQVISATLADPSVANELHLDVGAPLLQVRRIHYDDNGQPFEYMEMLASPTRFEMQMSIGEEDL